MLNLQVTKVYFILVINPCSGLPCKNGGTCIQPTNNGYICKCPIGYTGNNCELGKWIYLGSLYIRRLNIHVLRTTVVGGCTGISVWQMREYTDSYCELGGWIYCGSLCGGEVNIHR